MEDMPYGRTYILGCLMEGHVFWEYMCKTCYTGGHVLQKDMSYGMTSYWSTCLTGGL